LGSVEERLHLSGRDAPVSSRLVSSILRVAIDELEGRDGGFDCR
jgi:hypothetical protein